MLVDSAGVPLALVVTGANRHDVSQLERILDSVVIKRPDIFEYPQHLCLDKGYTEEPALEIVVLRGFIPHIKGRGEEGKEKARGPGHKARRWIVEAAHVDKPVSQIVSTVRKTQFVMRGLADVCLCIYCVSQSRGYLGTSPK
jgi:hypothetical protein